MGALDMFQVVKRDGELDEFKIGKITAAIHKAFDAKETTPFQKGAVSFFAGSSNFLL